MNHLTRRTMLHRGGMLGAVLALDAVSPALAGKTPAASSVRFKAIDARMQLIEQGRVVALYGAFERGLYAGLA